MSDVRLERLAHLLTHYSVRVKPGDWIGITGDVEVLPLLRALHREILRAGAHPSLIVTDEAMDYAMLREGSDDQLTWVDPLQTRFVEGANGYIRVAGVPNTRAKSNIDPLRIQKQQQGQGSTFGTFMRRTSTGDLRWAVTLYPTHGWAQEAGMSLEEFTDFVYAAAFCDRDDPAAEWLRLRDVQQQKIDWLKGKNHIRIEGENVELDLSIEGRTFVNSHGLHSISDGEIYTGPVETSANGWVRFSFPALFRGQRIPGIRLAFRDGKVIEASAAENERALIAALDTDEGARYLGEFAIGMNERIQQPTGQLLFDEKIGGTFHVAIGAGYPDTGSTNRSAIHWDLICDLRRGGRMYADGALFYENGTFVV
ncbi:MAG: aminopeptidase [Chloroflexi bacterium]|nr:aminopeptidase [Chloroflexota bacterium]